MKGVETENELYFEQLNFISEKETYAVIRN